jgi:hypothetical protein
MKARKKGKNKEKRPDHSNRLHLHRNQVPLDIIMDQDH